MVKRFCWSHPRSVEMGAVGFQTISDSADAPTLFWDWYCSQVGAIITLVSSVEYPESEEALVTLERVRNTPRHRGYIQALQQSDERIQQSCLSRSKPAGLMSSQNLENCIATKVR